LPVIRQQCSDMQQYDMVQRLLIDQKAQNAGWVLAWLTPHVTTTERQLLTDIVGRTALAQDFARSSSR
jgi:hypothetical protein